MPARANVDNTQKLIPAASDAAPSQCETSAAHDDEPPSTPDEPPSSSGNTPDVQWRSAESGGALTIGESRAADQRSLRVTVVFNVDYDNVEAGAAAVGAAAAESVRDVAIAVSAALASRGHDYTLVGVLDSDAATINAILATRPDVVFNLVESLGGDSAREAEFASALWAAGVACTGCPPDALAHAFRKDVVRETLRAACVPVATGYAMQSIRDCGRAAQHVGLPAFVKPARSDASIGIEQNSLVHTADELRAQVASLATRVAGPWMLEEWLPGREFNVALLPSGGAAVTEIDYSGCPADLVPMITYESKWVESSPEYYMRSVPFDARAEPSIHALLVAAGRAAFEAIGGRGYGRVDLRCDRDGMPRVIDVNPNPDLHPDAGYSIAAASAGYSYEDLIEHVVLEAVRAHEHLDTYDRAQRPSAADRDTGANRELSAR